MYHSGPEAQLAYSPTSRSGCEGRGAPSRCPYDTSMGECEWRQEQAGLTAEAAVREAEAHDQERPPTVEMGPVSDDKGRA